MTAALRPTRRGRAGFTLIEVVVSLLVTSVLLGAMVSAVLLASHAIPDPNRPDTAALDAVATLESIAVELETATAIVAMSDHAIEFEVADRTSDDDDAAERIRYEWDGTAGAPLWRRFNADAPVAVVGSVQSFVIAPATELVDRGEAPTVTSTEQVFAAQGNNDNSGSGVGFLGTLRLSCSVTPDLPADAVSWRITRVKLLLSPDGSDDETLAVSIDPAGSDGGPSGDPVQTVLVDENDLESNRWHEVTFSAAGGLDPAVPHHVVLGRSSGSGSAARILRSNDGATTPETSTWIDTGLGLWVELAGDDLPIWVFGTYEKPDPDWAAHAPSVARSVTFELRAGVPPGPTARLTVATLNRPEMP